jgi:hypothetical protein
MSWVEYNGGQNTQTHESNGHSSHDCEYKWIIVSDGESNLLYNQLLILFPLHFVVFKQTVSLDNWDDVEQVFSRTVQLSKVNVDPDTLTDMVSIMINNHVYKPSVKDIMDKYYEMFRDKNRTNKIDFFNSPTDVEDSDTDGWTGLERNWVLSQEEWVEWEASLSFIKITQSLIYWE